MTLDEHAEQAREFLVEACAPRHGSHASGTLDRAAAILAMRPQVARASIHTAAALGDEEGVRAFLAADPAGATATGGPYGWDPLTYLCFSRFLRLDPARSDGFVRSATALLDAGASPNSGWFEEEHQPHPEWESVLYGAAGVAHHAPLTRLLIDRGADPNDGEVVYHAPETRDNEVLRVLVDSGRLTAASLTTLLLRKTDWHDLEAIDWLLARGVDPNRLTQWGHTAIHGAIRSDNGLEIIELLVSHGADPWIPAKGETAVALAARRGRRDVLEMFERRGISTALYPRSPRGRPSSCARCWPRARR
jgi:ankyrin repeat protein